MVWVRLKDGVEGAGVGALLAGLDATTGFGVDGLEVLELDGFDVDLVVESKRCSTKILSDVTIYLL